jgi:hypothetical protein
MAYRAKKSAYTRRPVGVPIAYTPELLADGRRRYEQTEEPALSIADDFGINRNTLRALAIRLGWKRYKPPPRDLSTAAKLLAQAKGIKQADLALATPNETPGTLATAPMQQIAEPALSVAARPAVSETALPPVSDTIERLHRAVLEELTAVETMRAALTREPQSPADAERTARTLSNLTEILQKLQRMQCALPHTGSDDDDMPVDIDEFRRELARRIEAFVASRTDAGDAGASIV